MRAFYRGLTIFLIIWIVSNMIVTIATPRSEYIAATLADNPKLVLIDASRINSLDHYSSEVIHEEVINFLDDNRRQTDQQHGYLTIAAAICLVFAVIGWVRESIILRRSLALTKS